MPELLIAPFLAGANLESGNSPVLLQLALLCRDGWRCQACGAMSNLEVHHKEFRSQSGHDSEENLITLCTTCHTSVHHG
jgi:5-methylcytosine-specific restriction endonuclease McrA